MRIMTQNKPEAYRIFILILYRFAWPSRKIADPPKKKISFIFVKKIEKKKQKQKQFHIKTPNFFSCFVFVFCFSHGGFVLSSSFIVFRLRSTLTTTKTNRVCVQFFLAEISFLFWQLSFRPPTEKNENNLNKYFFIYI